MPLATSSSASSTMERWPSLVRSTISSIEPVSRGEARTWSRQASSSARVRIVLRCYLGLIRFALDLLGQGQLLGLGQKRRARRVLGALDELGRRQVERRCGLPVVLADVATEVGGVVAVDGDGHA